MKWSFCIAIIYCIQLNAQNFGGNPFSSKWKHIQTKEFKIIFQDGLEQQALRVANRVLSLKPFYQQEVGAIQHPIPIILQHQTIMSNGYVGLAPYRSEFYLTPPQNAFDLGGVNWLDKLAVHEWRHVAQYNHYNKGLSRVMGWFLGQEGRAVANAIAVPDWFFEGDAVAAETKFLQQGRGVLPQFLNQYKSIFAGDYTYNYQQLRNGSLRRFVPDHYALGYHLVHEANKRFGEDAWRKITADAAAFKSLVFPFQKAFHKHTGVTFQTFIKNALQFKKEEHLLNASAITSISPNNFTTYQYPYVHEDGSIYALKTSYQTIPQIVRISHQKESIVKVKGFAYDNYISFNGNWAVYANYKPHPRWGNIEYQDLVVLNLKSGEEKRLSFKQHLLTPDIHPSGDKIIALSQTKVGKTALVVVDVKKQEITTINFKSDALLVQPKWGTSKSIVYCIQRWDDGKTNIVEIDLKNHSAEAKEITKPTQTIIGFLQPKGDTILFTTTQNQNDEAWAVNLKNLSTYKVLSAPFGVHQVTQAHHRDSVVAAVFSAKGIHLVQSSANREQADLKDAFPNVKSVKLQYTDSIQVKPYNSFSNPFNFHSWRPLYERPEWSFTLYGNNVLNTIETTLGFAYNENERSSAVQSNLTLGGFYLQPNLNVEQIWNRSAVFNKDTIIHWNETNWAAGLKLPLNLSSGKHFRFLNLSSAFHTQKIQWTGSAKNWFDQENFSYASFHINYSSQIQKALQEIFPKWAFQFSSALNTSLSLVTANQWVLRGQVFLPGLTQNHHLVISGSYQARDTFRNYMFSNQFNYGRGYSSINFPRMSRLSLNYHFPIAYPEFGIAQLIYFLRCRVNMFYDAAVLKSLRTGTKYQQRSTGVELFFDTRWFNQQPISFGFRYSYLLDKDLVTPQRNSLWELVLPVLF